jgi:hypothetical protein
MFEMSGIMTEHPTEHTIHDPKCPVHRLDIKEICRCEKFWYEGKDCFENTVTYTKVITDNCKKHCNEITDYVRTDKGSFFNGWDKRKK